MYDGIINVYKEKGYTSHDVVAKLRGILKQKKIGHTGTLDPEAEGVLPVCLGKATRLCDMLTHKTKSYEAVLLLGRETDTQDITGSVIDSAEPAVTEEELMKMISSFEGEYDQIPPMYSALKVNGKRLYELAREGQVVERKPRAVTIYDITVLETRLPRVRMAVTCSKGTYIRTLCHDIGKKAGCGGCMESLIRTRAGRFCLESSWRLGEIERLRDLNQLEQAVVPVESFFDHYPAACTRPEGDKLVHNGNACPRSCFEIERGRSGICAGGEFQRVRMYDSGGLFIGIYECQADGEFYKPYKMFFI